MDPGAGRVLLWVFAIAIIMLTFCSRTHADPVHWGNEVAVCGSSNFDAQIGDGHDIHISRISGAVTGMSMEGASWFKAHQSLVVLTRDGEKSEATTTAREAIKQNNEIDGVLFMVNPKVFGRGHTAVPFDYHYEPSVLIPGGKLHLRIDTIGPGPQKPGSDCFDTETHMTIQWDTK